jgi:hypothetical protein
VKQERERERVKAFAIDTENHDLSVYFVCQMQIKMY